MGIRDCVWATVSTNVKSFFLPTKILFYKFVELFWLLQQFFWGRLANLQTQFFFKGLSHPFFCGKFVLEEKEKEGGKKKEGKPRYVFALHFFSFLKVVRYREPTDWKAVFFLEFLRHTVVSRTCLAAAQIAEIFFFFPFLQNARKVGNGLIFTPKSRFQTCSTLNFGSWHIHRAEEIGVTPGFSPIWSRKRKDRKFKFYSLLAPRSKLLLCGEIGPGQSPKF